MSIEVAAIVTLCVYNFVQFIFWSRAVQKLVDKLMSRNYAEYSHALNSAQAPVTKLQVEFDEDDSEDMQQLHSLVGN